MGLRGPIAMSALAEPPPPSDPLPPPSWLPQQAANVWEGVEPLLRKGGHFKPQHADALASWCCTAAEARHLAQVIARDGPIDDTGRLTDAARHAVKVRTLLLATGKSIGLCPASATRLTGIPAPRVAEADPLEAFILKRDDIAARHAGG